MEPSYPSCRTRSGPTYAMKDFNQVTSSKQERFQLYKFQSILCECFPFTEDAQEILKNPQYMVCVLNYNLILSVCRASE